jgi:hypothetical protein
MTVPANLMRIFPFSISYNNQVYKNTCLGLWLYKFYANFYLYVKKRNVYNFYDFVNHILRLFGFVIRTFLWHYEIIPELFQHGRFKFFMLTFTTVIKKW